jgi:hypothetical protein
MAERKNDESVILMLSAKQIDELVKILQEFKK